MKSITARRVVSVLSLAGAGLVVAAGTASADTPDPRVNGNYTGGISPIEGYGQSDYTMNSEWVVANQNTINAWCPAKARGPQQNLATITGNQIQSAYGFQLTDVIVTTNDAFGCA